MELARVARARPWPRINVVHDWIFLRGVKVRRLEHEAIQVSLLVARFDREWRRRDPAGGHEFRDVLLGNVNHDLTVVVANYSCLRLRTGGVNISKVVAVGR